ncbi:MAG: hypothetical protein NT149_01040 [Candidatus Gottesmanbacteria bacterium]|nr:hypothetical protein [Candidatus Gottesmanbacteria bacterium]
MFEAIKAFRNELRTQLSGPDQLIYNKPPLVGGLLADLREIEPEIRQTVLNEITARSHQYDNAYLMTMMMRKTGDRTGLMSLLIGRSHSPAETLAIVESQGRTILDQLGKLPDEEHNLVFAMLNGNKTSWKAVLTLDTIMEQTVNRLKTEGVPPAIETFRGLNEDALKELYADEHRKQTLNKKNQVMYQLFTGALKPTIFYRETAGVVHQQYMLPAMPLENQELLNAILPEEISQTETDVGPYSPLGIMFYINMAGHPLARSTATFTQQLLGDRWKQLAQMNPDQVRMEAIRNLMSWKR